MSFDAIRQLRYENDRLRTQLSRLESNIRQTWIGPGMTTPPAATVLTVGGGNTIYNTGGVTITGLNGAVVCTGVPTLAPTGLDTVYADGLTAAYITGTTTLVWLAAMTQSYITEPIYSDGVYTVPRGKTVLARQQATVVCAATGTNASVYLVWTP